LNTVGILKFVHQGCFVSLTNGFCEGVALLRRQGLLYKNEQVIEKLNVFLRLSLP
jgi:hypothetical protein